MDFYVGTTVSSNWRHCIRSIHIMMDMVVPLIFEKYFLMAFYKNRTKYTMNGRKIVV